MNKAKRIIGKICKYLLWNLLGFFVLCAIVASINAFGILITVIATIAGTLIVFIIYAAINWGGWGG